MSTGLLPTELLSSSTLPAVLSLHAQQMGDRIAGTFVSSDERRTSVTYRELVERATSISRHLLGRIDPGARALLMYPAGLDFVEAFLGCMFAGVIPVPAYPPRHNRKQERLNAIADDCEAAIALCLSKHVPELAPEFRSRHGMDVVGTDRWEAFPIESSNLPDIQLDQTAFIQYSSGSTGTPKGIVITHRNLTANQASIRQAFGHGPHSKIVSWLPNFHDMGLVGTTLQPLFVGFPFVSFSPEDFIRDPSKWLLEISREGATTSGAPNFAFDYCVDRIPDSVLEQLDLSSWSVAFNGSEPVRSTTLDRFTQRFARCGFTETAWLPCYGMAEATLFVCGGPAGRAPARVLVNRNSYLASQTITTPEEHPKPLELVPCGRPGATTEVVVVDPQTVQPLADGTIGEVWIRGDGVSPGYWRSATATAESFGWTLPDLGGNWLRTGDLGFLTSGQIVITGRSKDVIIVRGRNLHAEDIEASVRHVMGLSAAYAVAAVERPDGAGSAVGLLIECDSTLSLDEAQSMYAELTGELAHDFGVGLQEVLFVRRTIVPRTSSGKLQRHWIRHNFASFRPRSLHAITREGFVHD